MLFLEEIWSRNFTNLFIAPLRISEIIISLVLTALLRTLIGLVPAILITSPLFGISILDLGTPLFLLIFSEAFNFNTMVQGGFWGLVLIGIRRAVFSSESGVGLAPIYHGQSSTKHGTDEGLVGMLGPILDTILVCTITGLIIKSERLPKGVKLFQSLAILFLIIGSKCSWDITPPPKIILSGE